MHRAVSAGPNQTVVRLPARRAGIGETAAGVRITTGGMSEPVILEKRLYTAHATATHGRDGRVLSDDGQLDLAVAPPKAMGGNGAGTNPEQLFAAGYAACFGSALALQGESFGLIVGMVAQQQMRAILRGTGFSKRRIAPFACLCLRVPDLRHGRWCEDVVGDATCLHPMRDLRCFGGGFRA